MTSKTDYQPVSLVVEDRLAEPREGLLPEPNVYPAGDASSGHKSPVDMPLEARTLRPGTLVAILTWSWDILLTVLPVLFLVLPVLAIRLDSKPTSEYGSRIIEITRLSPTLYPILFAMAAARFYKNLARWSLERPRGIQLSLLEQIIGSQSFASAIERFIIVRAQLLMGTLIVFTWLLSPIGGQSSSRLLEPTRETMITDGTVYYGYPYNSSAGYYRFGEGSTYAVYESAITTLYVSALLSTPKQKGAFLDLWSRPKIPMWPRRETETPAGSWREVNTSALTSGEDYYTSLIGVRLQGLQLDDPTVQYNFSVLSSYLDFECSMEALYTNFTEAEENLETDGFNLTGRVFNDISRPEKYSSFAFKELYSSKSRGWTDMWALLYVSKDRSGEQWEAGISVFKCPMRFVELETNMLCTGQACSPARQRLLPNSRSLSDFFDEVMAGSSMRGLLDRWPTMAGKVKADQASPTDAYISNEDVPYNGQGWRRWKYVDPEILSARLTVLFNTVMHAGIEPFNVTSSVWTDPPILDDKGQPQVGTNLTSATITREQRVYRANRSWAAILILATAVLQIFAIGGLILQCLIRGPDILGFASSLTRDNSFVPLSGGSALGGAERARAARDVRLRLADMKPAEDHGYIALSALPMATLGGAGDNAMKEGLGWRALDKRRMYD